MRVRLFTFRYSASLGGFDDSPLEAFVRDREVVAFREHFYSVNEVPHVTCVVTYQDAVVPPEVLLAAAETPRRAQTPRSSPSRRNDDRPDPTADLSEPERALFNTRERSGRYLAERCNSSGLSFVQVVEGRVRGARSKPDVCEIWKGLDESSDGKGAEKAHECFALGAT
jgi:hypothetical protein